MIKLKIQGVSTSNIQVAWGMLMVLLLAPIAASYQSLTPAWDEMYFMHRAVCANRAVYDLSLSDLNRCFAHMSKSPVLAFLLIPFGSVDVAQKLLLSMTGLALLCFVQVLILIRLAQRINLSPAATLVAALATFVAAPLAAAPAPFLVDGLLSLTVICLLLLVIGEATDHERTPSRKDNILRGLIWGWILGVGLLSKLTFLYFAGVAGCAGLILSFHTGGWVASRQKLLGCCISIWFPLLIFVRYFDNYAAHAATSSFGNLSAFYDDGLGRWEYLRTALPEVGIWYWGVIAALIAASVFFPAARKRGVAGIFIFLIVLGYLWIASGSPNKDARFFWPVWASLPFCLAVLVRPGQPSLARPSAKPILVSAVLATLLTLPSAVRLDLSTISEADAVLMDIAADTPLTVMLASDEGDFNIETLLLAREINFDSHHKLRLDTVVYDITRGMTREQSLERLLGSDVVIFRDPINAEAPEWANRHLAFFAQEARERCAIQTKVGTSTYILQHCR